MSDSMSRTELRICAFGDMVTPIFIRDGGVKRWILEDYMGEEVDLPVYTKTQFCDKPSNSIQVPCFIRSGKRMLWRLKEAPH